MIDWGNVPAGTRATIYLPTVDADAALEWAHRMYVSNRLSLVDAHTLECEAGGVTFVPVPGYASIDHAGLLAVSLPPTVHKGERYSVRVRQITGARFGKGRQVEIGAALRGRKDQQVAVAAAAPARSSPSRARRAQASSIGARSVRSGWRSRSAPRS